MRKRFIKESKGSGYDLLAALQDKIEDLESFSDFDESVDSFEDDEKRHWLDTELSNYEFGKLRDFLWKNKIKYEPSQVDKYTTYVKVYVTEDEADRINKFIDSISIDGPSTPYKDF